MSKVKQKLPSRAARLLTLLRKQEKAIYGRYGITTVPRIEAQPDQTDLAADRANEWNDHCISVADDVRLRTVAAAIARILAKPATAGFCTCQASPECVRKIPWARLKIVPATDACSVCANVLAVKKTTGGR